MKFAILALLGIASVDANQYHKHPYHHYKQKYSIAQVEADPKDAKKEEKPPTPADNRKTYEKAIKAAGMTVDTQESFESTKTADVASRNAANTKQTFDLKASVRNARQDQIQGEVGHRQWVTRSDQTVWAQTHGDEEEEKKEAAEAALKKDADDKDHKDEEAKAATDEKNGADDASVKAAAAEDAKAPKAEGAAADGDKKKPAGDGEGKGGQDSSKDGDAAAAQAPPPPQNPDNAYKVKAASLEKNLGVVSKQREQEAAWNKQNNAARAKQDRETDNKLNGLRISRREMTGGDNYRTTTNSIYLKDQGTLATLAQKQAFVNARSGSSSSSDSDNE